MAKMPNKWKIVKKKNPLFQNENHFPFMICHKHNPYIT